MTCYLCDKPAARHRKFKTCATCEENLLKWPKFGYERPSPPKEMAEAA